MALSKIDAANFLTGTIPDTNINNASLDNVTGLPAGVGGKVLQVVQSIGTGATFTTTSTSFVATGTSVSITPSSTSSKIFVMCSTGLFWVNTSDATASGGGATIYRGATNINPNGGGTKQMMRNYRIGGVSIQNGGLTMSVLDSPNTTSSTTYTAYIKSIWNNPTIQWNSSDDDVAVITAMEIAG